MGNAALTNGRSNTTIFLAHVGAFLFVVLAAYWLRRIALQPDAILQGYLRSEEHTSELQSRLHLVCRLLLEKKKKQSLDFSTPTHAHHNCITATATDYNH